MQPSLSRVCMISVHSSPLARLGGKEAGGMNVYVRELACELGQLGMSVDIFTRIQDVETPRIQYLTPRVRVINVRAGDAVPYDKYKLLDHIPEFVHRICLFAEEQHIQYGIIHSHYWISGEVALRLRQIWQIPIVHMFHTLGSMKNRVARSEQETEQQVRTAIERRLLHEVDSVVAATTLEREYMARTYAADSRKITVVPCGVNVQRFQPYPPADARARLDIPHDAMLLLCVGRMEPLKGMDSLIRALALLVERFPSWQHVLRVILIGGESEAHPERWNPEQQRLAALRESLGVRDAVAFLGAQPQEVLPLYYAAADVTVVPSHYESFGLVALEAQACGACVVASRVGGLAYIVEDGKNGVLVPPDNPEQLADSLALLLEDWEYRLSLGCEARRHAIRLSWNHVANRIICLYNTVLLQSVQRYGAIQFFEGVSSHFSCEREKERLPCLCRG